MYRYIIMCSFIFFGSPYIYNNDKYDMNLYTGVSYEEESEEEIYEDIYKELDIEEIEKELNAKDIDIGMDFSQVVREISQGNIENVIQVFKKSAGNILTGELSENRKLMIQLISIVLLGSIFMHISGSFGNGFIGENGFYVTYLIITSILLVSFSIALDVVSSALEVILTLIRVIVPVYAVAMNFVGHSSVSMSMYNLIMLGVWVVQAVILKFIVPMIKFYVTLSFVNNLNKEENFSKLCQLIKSAVSWLLKTIVIFVVGLNIIKSLIDPQIDALGRNTVNKVISSFPGGGMMSVLTGTFLGAGMIIKNSIGIAGIIILGLVVLFPVLKTFLIMLTVKLVAAMVQPVAEKRYVTGIETLSQGIGLLLQALGSSVVLFVLTLAIMAFASNGGG
ncbi:MAG: hypothetical protein E7259_01645 [Lachnospiraceae bacterium]|nr:hypothetical protein [Lachnospiraceae bacterium]